MSQSASETGFPASPRPSSLRLVIGLILAAPLPALLVAALGVTHEIWLALGATAIMLHALFATTGVVRISVPGATWPSNLFRASLVGAFIAVASTLDFVAFFVLAAPTMALMICLGLSIIGMIAGAIFWLCVYV